MVEVTDIIVASTQTMHTTICVFVVQKVASIRDIVKAAKLKKTTPSQITSHIAQYLAASLKCGLNV